MSIGKSDPIALIECAVLNDRKARRGKVTPENCGF